MEPRWFDEMWPFLWKPSFQHERTLSQVQVKGFLCFFIVPTLFAWATVLPPLCQYVKNWAISVDFGDFRPFPASHCFRNILSLGQVLGVKVNSWELKKFWNLAQLTFSTFNFFSWAIFFTKKFSEVRFLISQNPPKLQNFFSLIGAKKRQKRQNV